LAASLVVTRDGDQKKFLLLSFPQRAKESEKGFVRKLKLDPIFGASKRITFSPRYLDRNRSSANPKTAALPVDTGLPPSGILSRFGKCFWRNPSRRRQVGEPMKSNVVPISRARSVARHAPARTHLRPVAGRKGAAVSRPALEAGGVPNTPIWLSIFALVAMTMWPSALVWTVKLAYRIAGW